MGDKRHRASSNRDSPHMPTDDNTEHWTPHWMRYRTASLILNIFHMLLYSWISVIPLTICGGTGAGDDVGSSQH